jgi:UDP-N-acetylmuramate dehydrogenase
MEILHNIPLAPLTTLGIGGPARYFVNVQTAADAREAVLWAREHGQPLFILGGGSNLVVSDEGWPGLVAHITIAGMERQPVKDETLYDVGAGTAWDEFVQHVVAEECAGVECLSGIPGTVGGTPVQNVGAYGQEVSETIRSVQALDLDSLEFVNFGNCDCGFHYRASRFNTADQGRFLILRVVFTLRPGGAPCLRYADLKVHLGEHAAQPSLAEVRQAVIEIRRRKAMVVEDAEPDSRSAGSFFKNPLITYAHYQRIAERYEAKEPFATTARPSQTGLRVPSFDAGDGRVKIPAAWLVEQAGVQRGFQLGPVAVSGKHALALVNRGGATAADLLKLKDLVQAKVRDAFDIELEPEPVFVGFST